MSTPLARDHKEDHKPLGIGSGEGAVPTPREIFLEYSCKKCRVDAFLLQKTTCGQNPGPRALVNSPGGLKM